ncbi:MAG: Pyridoxal-5-phosphate-dependent protein beta subunit [Actinomycetia bacterium]|nr:Pyridoxal-5-phosphate-dependent protein beta subunit [Actinomycetes bacterium]
MVELVSQDEVRAAAARLAGITVRTPLVPFPRTNVPVKPESLQPAGAFKLRGAYAAITALSPQERQRGVVAHSSSNHRFAVAYAAALLGVRAAIAVPRNAPEVKTSAIASCGAELVYVEPTLAARVAGCDQIAADFGGLTAGDGPGARQSGDGTGLAVRTAKPAAALVPVSGDGLISGIAVAIRALLPGTEVIGVEPELAADARDSLRQGFPVAWPAADVARTAADALRVEQVGDLTFAHIRELVTDIVTVTAEQMPTAVRRLALEARLVAEPGGAIAVAAALDGVDGIPQATPEHPVVAVLSGGNISPTLLAEVLAGQNPSYTK